MEYGLQREVAHFSAKPIGGSIWRGRVCAAHPALGAYITIDASNLQRQSELP